MIFFCSFNLESVFNYSTFMFYRLIYQYSVCIFNNEFNRQNSGEEKNNSHCEIVTSGFDSSAQFDWKNELRCHDSLECLIPSTNAFLVEIASLRSDRNAYHSSPFDHSLMWFQFDFSENEILCHFVTCSKTTELI